MVDELRSIVVDSNPFLVKTRCIKEIMLVVSNQSYYFENAIARSKRTLQMRVAMQLKGQLDLRKETKINKS